MYDTTTSHLYTTGGVDYSKSHAPSVFYASCSLGIYCGLQVQNTAVFHLPSSDCTNSGFALPLLWARFSAASRDFSARFSFVRALHADQSHPVMIQYHV